MLLLRIRKRKSSIKIFNYYVILIEHINLIALIHIIYKMTDNPSMASIL